ncbi:hypothetical protein PAF17_17825 [Paracoccus sp. Z330]|uniref:Dienelactone hydrolase n=1 Tax=Paracoccus onchidii TaxID=3017813 RepID=A0ABT4ZJ44_9RHOB|nr:hypothetical protein [Paracoccus onchidii]MDB6179346.1 hypothetical protein [Paracoccus onchidii]
MLKAVSTVFMVFFYAMPGLAESRIGVRTIAATDGDALRHLSLSVWYPAKDGGSLEDVGGNAVFVGQPAYRDAAMAAGPFPLLLLSHGGLRSATDSGAWLSGRLAEKGFVVVEVNSPRPDSAAIAVNAIWQRPQDVSHALDRVLQDQALSAVIDPARIAVTGHALGGTAALALTGGSFDADAFASTCAADADGPDCAWYTAQGVSLADVDREMLERAHRDPRISTAIAIDPEYADVFLAPSLKDRGADIQVIWLSAPDHPQFADTGLSQTVIATATGYDAFPLCTPKGKYILAEEGGDAALCDGDAAGRARIHDEIAGRLGAALDR